MQGWMCSLKSRWPPGMSRMSGDLTCAFGVQILDASRRGQPHRDVVRDLTSPIALTGGHASYPLLHDILIC